MDLQYVDPQLPRRIDEWASPALGQTMPIVSYGSFGHGTNQQKVKEPKKYMFLCEVVLGKTKKYYNAQDVTDLPNSNHQSVFAVGRVGPDPAGNIYLPNGCVIPIGNIVQTPEPKLPAGQYWGLQHNEFVVYDTSQVRIRYLLELR